ncbi:hypothetical protein T484DRAFT_1822572 [Baffinella frigidus]|nr:hypothetical protein T484DRAFT_1822572 [Cryptophyta sp. CCMP2293]
MHRVMASWRAATAADAAFVAEAYRRKESVGGRKRLVLALHAWTNVSHAVRKARTVVSKLKGESAATLQRRAFAAMRLQAGQHKRVRLSVGRFLLSKNRSGVAEAWAAWHTLAATARRLRVATRRVVTAILMHGQVAAMQRWVEVVHEGRRERALLRKTVSRALSVLLSARTRVFELWRARTVDARIARNRVISRMHAFATQSLSAGFARWVEYRGKEKGEREEERLHQNLASLSVLRILLAGKAKAFLAWKRHVRRRREVEERRGAGRVRMARVVVQGWRVGAEEERVWREMVLARMAAMMGATSRSHLLAWLALVRDAAAARARWAEAGARYLAASDELEEKAWRTWAAWAVRNRSKSKVVWKARLWAARRAARACVKAWAWTVGDAVRGRAAAARVCGWVVVDSLRAALAVDTQQDAVAAGNAVSLVFGKRHSPEELQRGTARAWRVLTRQRKSARARSTIRTVRAAEAALERWCASRRDLFSEW